MTEAAMTTYHTRAILLGLEHAHSYAALRSFTSAGIEVVGISLEPLRRLRLSRRLSQHHRVHSDEDALRILEGLAPGGGTLIPFTDEFLVLLSKHHARLSENFRVTVPPWDILRPLVDQREAYKTARDLGIDTPTFFVPRDEAEMRDIAEGLDLEHESYLLKTFLEAGPANVALNRFTLLAGTSREEVIANCMAIFKRNAEFPMIAQVIPGGAEDSYGVVMLAGYDHRPAFAYAIRRLKLYKSSHGGHPGAEFTVGANCYCEVVDDPEAIEAAARVVEHSKFTGPIVMEYRRDARDGRLVLVKPDPRMTLATGLSRALGVDLPLQTYRLFNGLPLAPVSRVMPGARWFWLAAYIDALWTERHHRPMRREVMRTLRSAGRIRSIAFWDTRDPLPFLVDLAVTFARRVRGFLRGINLANART